MKKFIVIYLLFAFVSVFANDMPAYKIFTSDGKEVRFANVIDNAVKADIIFFGELHNNPIAHWLEYEVTKALYSKKHGKIILGAEMFEADNQLILDEYLHGCISEKNFLKEMRLWNNYETDYRPLVEFAKKNNITFVATNIPRRYAAIVSKSGFKGLDVLSKQAKSYIAPLPIKYDPSIGCYKKMLAMKSMPGAMGHNIEYLPQAQAIKDATMAYFILKNFDKNKIFIHFNGAYHSDNHEGIIWHIKSIRPDIKILTISTVEQNNIDNLNKKNFAIGDFIIVVDEDMTKTY